MVRINLLHSITLPMTLNGKSQAMALDKIGACHSLLAQELSSTSARDRCTVVIRQFRWPAPQVTKPQQPAIGGCYLYLTIE